MVTVVLYVARSNARGTGKFRLWHWKAQYCCHFTHHSRKLSIAHCYINFSMLSYRPTLLLENYQPWLDLKVPSKVDASLSEVIGASFLQYVKILCVFIMCLLDFLLLVQQVVQMYLAGVLTCSSKSQSKRVFAGSREARWPPFKHGLLVQQRTQDIEEMSV